MSNENEWQKVESDLSEAILVDWGEKKELVGIYKEKRENVGENNSNMYYVKADDKEVYCFWGKTVLNGKLKEVEIGEEVKVVYLGQKKSEGSGREYADFDVFHRPAPMKEVE